MIELSPRLRAVASLVPRCRSVADVGTDHAYLASWLLQNGIAQSVDATDIHAGPLERGKLTASEQGLEAQIRFHLCDGLQFPGAEKTDAVVIAGMGGETMVSILEAAPWAWKNTSLILQPQSKVDTLVAWLREHSISLHSATLCADAGKRYLCLLAAGPGNEFPSPEDLLYQACDPLLSSYLKDELARIDRAIFGMQLAARNMQPQINALHMQRQKLDTYRKALIE